MISNDALVAPRDVLPRLSNVANTIIFLKAFDAGRSRHRAGRPLCLRGYTHPLLPRILQFIITDNLRRITERCGLSPISKVSARHGPDRAAKIADRPNPVRRLLLLVVQKRRLQVIGTGDSVAK